MEQVEDQEGNNLADDHLENGADKNRGNGSEGRTPQKDNLKTDTKGLTLREAELEAYIAKDTFDSEAWEQLVEELPGKDIERIRSVMERLLERYPMAGYYWVKYAEYEEAAKENDRVRDILKRVLYSCYSVDVWVFYLSWLRRTRLGNKAAMDDSSIQAARVELANAFEEAIKPKNAGVAMDAEPLWRAYLDFLNEESEKTQYEEGQKLVAIRKLYQRVVRLPIRGLELFWREYQQFETSKSAITAKKLLEDEQPRYQHAAEVLKEREIYWRPVLPVVVIAKEAKQLPRRPSLTNLQLLDHWQKLLTYEKTNPEQLPPVDFKVKVRLAYRRALAELRFHPEVWFGFADFERSVSDDEASLTILRESLRALPESAVLHFCLADALEMDGAKDEARQVLDTLLDRQPSGLAFIQRMRFSRRSEGVAASRAIFRKARAWQGCDSSIYCCAAEIEYRANKLPSVARNVFELGLKRFPHDLRLAHRYLDLMLLLNDDGSTRDVFERIIDAFHSNRQLHPNDELQSIWERYREFERDGCRNAGDLKLVQQIEKRMLERNLGHVGLASVLHRYALYDVEPSPQEKDLFQKAGLLHAAASNGTKIITIRSSNSTSSTSIGGGANNSNQAGGGGGMGLGMTSSSLPLAKQQQQQQDFSKEDASVPSFLKKLVSVLPRRVHGLAQMDVDFVIRSLKTGFLPPPPQRSSSSSSVSDKATTGGKRRAEQALGADHAPPDAFKHRQQQKRKR